ncbi:MAG: LysM domain-containing protein [Thiotrichaceae bacterium]
MKLSFPLIITVIATTSALASLSGCTVYLPPSEETIPAADPIIVPGKATTVKKPDNKGIIEINPSKSEPAKTITNEKGTSPTAPKVQEKNSEPSRQGHIFYVVKPKDTVFEVMRKTGVNWQEIIRLNHLQAPAYTIFPGQNLRIK